MNTRYQTTGWIFVVALAVVFGPGCSSKAVRYEVDSSTTEQEMKSPEPTTSQESYSMDGRMFTEEGESINPGAVPSTQASLHTSDMPEGTESRNGMQFFSPGEGVSGEGAQYGHEYTGAPGSHSGSGPVTGFGHGSAPGVSPDPEEWARTYLGKGNADHEATAGDSNNVGPHESSSGEGANYGHQYPGVPGSGPGGGPVTGFGHGSAPGVSPGPEDWAQGYLRSEGGLTPEHVTQEVLIAKADPSSSMGDGAEREQSSMNFQSTQHQRTQGTMGRLSRGASSESTELQDVYFDFDSWRITHEAGKFLVTDAQWLKANGDTFITIEGHCDQRGTRSYNMVLGKKRAEATRDYLVDLGVTPSQINVVSYGKERLFCENESHSCYQQNRRGHFTLRMP